MEDHHKAKCHLSDQEWQKAQIARCDLEYTDCEENRFCREVARRKQPKRKEWCNG